MLAILLCIGLIISCAACGRNEDNYNPPHNTVVSNPENTENDVLIPGNNNINSSNTTSSEDITSNTEDSSDIKDIVDKNEEQELENVNSNDSVSSENTGSKEETSSVPENNIVEKPNHTHSYKSTKVSPTCTTKGYTKYACECGSTYTDSVKSALGHNWGSWVTTKEPTTTSTGTKKKTCSRCSAYETKTVDVLELSQKEFDELVCKYTLQYINDFREEEGANRLTELTGKGKQFAELRSEQLSSNFAHDEDDIQAACRQIDYGKRIIEPEIRWDPIEQKEYYTGNVADYYAEYGAEAIARRSAIVIKNEENAKMLAFEFAKMCHESSKHWCYVGNDIYKTGVIGAYFDGWQMYVCMLVHTTGKYD